MAEKRPLCLYGGRVKRLQPGDTIIGAYNATEAGWIVNASAYLVATPGSTKISGKVVTGSIWALDSTGIIMRSPLAGPVLSFDNDGQVTLGSAAPAANRFHIQKKGSGSTGIRMTNDTTGHTSGDGFLVGIDASEQPYLYNYENTNMNFYTNNLIRYRIKSDGVMHAYYAASLDSTMVVGDDVTLNASFVVRGNASIDGNLVVGGTGAFGNSVTITADVQVAAGQKFFMDGGSDTYWTATNDIITGHVNSASVVHFKSTTTHITTAASIDGAVTYGGHLSGPSGNITSLNVSTATLPTIGGKTTFTGAIVGRTTASLDGSMNIGGDLVVTGSLRVKDQGHYIGDNTLGDNAADTQKLVGIGIASGPFSVYQAFVGKLTASINSTLNVGGAVTLNAHTTAPSANITSLNTTTATVTTLGVTTANITDANITTVDAVNASLSGNASIDGTLDLGGAFVARSTASIDGAVTLGGHFIAPSGNITSLNVTTATIPTLNGNVTVGGTFDSTGAVVFRSTASLDGAVTLGGHFVAPSANITSLNVTTATIGTLSVVTGNLNVGASLVASTVRVGGTTGARLKNCTINASGAITGYTGDDLMLNSLASTNCDQQFIAEKVWNSVYNDVVDWQDLADDAEAIYGKVYVDSYDGARVPTSRCQKSVIGICSDTFGFAVGRIQGRKQIPVSVAGWALAHVDRAYESGEPLTNTSSGCLTSMTATEKREYPERLVAIYKRPETASLWQGRVKVNRRHWVKVR